MTTRFLSNGVGAGGLNNGTSWANAYLTSAAAAAATVAGDLVWIGDDHVESIAATTTLSFTAAGAEASPIQLICADHTKASPGSGDLKTTASISITGLNNFFITSLGMYIYGVNFSSGGILQFGTTSHQFHLENCSLTYSSGLALGGTAGNMTLKNCTWKTLTATTSITKGTSIIRLKGGSQVGPTVPTTWMTAGNNVPSTLFIEDFDFSLMGSGKTLFGSQGLSTTQTYVVKNCRLGTSVTLVGTLGSREQVIFFVNCDSGNKNYNNACYRYEGNQLTETTVVRTGGASDGTTPASWKITTNTHSSWLWPFDTPRIGSWNENIGSPITVTIYGTINSASIPNNDDIFIEIEDLTSTLYPLGASVNSGKANVIATGSPLTADVVSTWGGGGSGAGWSPFSMSVSITPTMKGMIYLKVSAAKAGTTFYIDPKPVLT